MRLVALYKCYMPLPLPFSPSLLQIRGFGKNNGQCINEKDPRCIYMNWRKSVTGRHNWLRTTGVVQYQPHRVGIHLYKMLECSLTRLDTTKATQSCKQNRRIENILSDNLWKLLLFDTTLSSPCNFRLIAFIM